MARLDFLHAAWASSRFVETELSIASSLPPGELAGVTMDGM